MAKIENPQTADQYVVPTDPEKLIAWIEKKRESGKHRLPESMMRMHLAFVLGHQWVVWDASKGMFRRPANRSNDPNPPVRITANKIGSIVERTIAMIVQDLPLPEARPTSESEEAIG